MTNWLERLLGHTQVKLLQLLRRPPQTVTAMSQALGVTDNAVRNHIAALGRDGIVEQVGAQRDTGGKPATVYALTEEGEELFPKAYAVILGALVEEIARSDGPEHAVELLRRVGVQAGTEVAGSADAGGRVAEAAAALRSLGGDVEVQPAPGGWRIQGYGCPLSAVTRTHPQVCALAQALVEKITRLPVTERCDRTGRPRCAFLVDSEPKRKRSRTGVLDGPTGDRRPVIKKTRRPGS